MGRSMTSGGTGRFRRGHGSRGSAAGVGLHLSGRGVSWRCSRKRFSRRRRMPSRSIVGALLAGVLLGLVLAVSPASATTPARSLSPDSRFLVPLPNQAGVQQAVSLLRAGQVRNALLVGALLTKPHAVWVTKGTPTDARNAVRNAVILADFERAVPVLVAYDIPGRDCGGFSAGGAQNTADYKAWIDGFATG